LGSNYWTWYASRIHDSISNKATKYIGFSADESASQCVGFTADSALRYRTNITTSGYTYVSTFGSKPKKRVGSIADTSTTVSGDDAAAQVSYKSPGKQISSSQQSHGFSMILRLAACAMWMCPMCLILHNVSLVRGQHRAIIAMRWCCTNHHPINPLSKLHRLHRLLSR